jgi:NADH-quinone oxidoreductase subunit C
MHKDLADFINQRVSAANAQVLAPQEVVGDSSILVEAEHIYAVLDQLKNHPRYPFKVLQVISGVDYIDFLEVNYMLATFDVHASADVMIKVRIKDRINPEVDSVVNLYKAANFQERECFDMFGIKFKNHPDLRRILCPDDWQGYPLRKDYVAAKYYNGMEVFPDDKMNSEDREYIALTKEKQDELVKKSLAKGL